MMYRSAALCCVLALLSACTEWTRTVEDDSDAWVPTCDTTIVSTNPRNGSMEAYYRQAIEFELSEPDPTAEVFADFSGEQTTREDGLVVVYTPDAPLEALTEYTVGLDYCRGAPEISFFTSELGLSLDEEADLLGRTYELDLGEVRFLAGEGLEEVAATLVSPTMLVSAHTLDEDGIHLRVAMPSEEDPEAQDYCVRTVDLPVAYFGEAPYFSVSATDVSFGASSAVVDLRRLDFTGTVSPDGAWMGGGTFTAVLDTRDIAQIIVGSSPETLCAIASGLGVACEMCPHDGEEWCVTLDILDVNAEWLPGVEVDPILEANADSRCGGTSTN
jgi:hypothetical protein